MKIINKIKSSKIIKNSGWLMAQNIITMILGVFVTGIVARYFGTEKYGIFNYAYSIIALFIGISPFGIHHIAVKDLAQRPKEEGKILGTSFVLRSAITVILLVISNITVFYLSKFDRVTTIIGAILSTLIIFNVFDVIDYYSKANLKAKYIVISKLISFVFMSILKVLVIIMKGNIIHYSITYALEAFIYAILLIISYRLMKKGGTKVKWHYNKQYAKQLLSKSWYFALSSIMVTIYLRIDQVMIGTIIPDKSQVGIYSAAVKIAEMWSFVPLALINSYKPIIMTEKRISDENYHNKLRKLYNLSWIICLMFLVFIIALGKLIITILYGADFINAYKILNILIPGICVGIVGNIHYIWMLCEGKEKYSLLYSSSGCVTNIILNLILIPRIGMHGAAIATMISQLVSNVLIFMIRKDTRVLSINMIRAIFLIDYINIFKNKIKLVIKGEK